MRRWLLLAAVCGLCACKSKSGTPTDAATSKDAVGDKDQGADTGGMPDGAGADGGGGAIPCLDKPGDLLRPPAGRLPCELLPPGFK